MASEPKQRWARVPVCDEGECLRCGEEKRLAIPMGDDGQFGLCAPCSIGELSDRIENAHGAEARASNRHHRVTLRRKRREFWQAGVTYHWHNPATLPDFSPGELDPDYEYQTFCGQPIAPSGASDNSVDPVPAPSGSTGDILGGKRFFTEWGEETTDRVRAEVAAAAAAAGRPEGGP